MSKDRSKSRTDYVLYNLQTEEFLSNKTEHRFNKSFKHAVVFKHHAIAKKWLTFYRTRNYTNLVVLPVKVQLDEKDLFKAVLSGR